MTPRRVRFTTTAQERVKREKAWWIENRTHIDIFATEIEQALKILGILPGAGTPYIHADVAGLCRLTSARSPVIFITRSTITKWLSALSGARSAAQGLASSLKRAASPWSAQRSALNSSRSRRTSGRLVQRVLGGCRLRRTW